MVSFIISFDRKSRRYIAGETVHCKVQITVHKNFQAQSLKLRWLGIAQTSWSNINRDRPAYEIQEIFCFYELIHAEPIDVFPGNYEYDRSFTIPFDLPSSLAHENGEIYYSVTANYDVPKWFDKSSDKSKQEYFFVTAQLNLNNFPEYAEPVKGIKTHTFGWCKTAPMLLILYMPKLGYIPGEVIPITIEVDNHSNVAIKAVQVKIKEKMTFISLASLEIKYKISTLKEHTFSTTTAPFQNKLFQTKFMLDPNSEWKLFHNCEIISCDYIIKVKARTSGCHLNPSFETKIVIGTEGTLNANTDPVTMNEEVILISQPSSIYAQADLYTSAGYKL